jgi:hypothetical protein
MFGMHKLIAYQVNGYGQVVTCLTYAITTTPTTIGKIQLCSLSANVLYMRNAHDCIAHNKTHDNVINPRRAR